MNFIYLIVTFWKIVSFLGPYADIRFCDEVRAAIRSENNENIEKLLELDNIFENVQSTGRQKKSLTKDTSMGLSYTCKALADLENCILKDHEFSYVCLDYLHLIQ